MIAHIMERFFSGEPAVGVTDNIACGLVRAAIDAARIVMEDPRETSPAGSSARQSTPRAS